MKQDKTWTTYENSLLNKGLTRLRIQKLHTMYNVVKRGLKKPLIDCTREDLEEFITRLHRNEFLRQDGKKLSGNTKADIKRFIKQFLKWAKGNDEEVPKEAKWIKTNIAKEEKSKEKPTLSIEETRKFSQCFKKTEYQLLILLLFDTGFRIQELLSVKKRDLTWEPFDDENSCFWIKCNESKTEIRKIPIPLFTEEIQSFVNTGFYRQLGDDDLIFKMHYSNLIQQLKKQSIKAFNKIITPHCLRHSSATFYAGEYGGDVRLLAQRYGWTLSSKQLSLYIRRSGSYQREGAKKSFTNEVLQLKKRLAMMEKLLERIPVLEGALQKMKEGKVVRLQSQDMYEIEHN